MPGTGRIRSRSTLYEQVEGSFERPVFNIKNDYSYAMGLDEECADVVGNYLFVNGLRLTKEEYLCARADGEEIQSWDGKVARKYTNCPLPTTRRVPPSPQVPVEMSITDVNNYTWALKARANPNATHVNVLAFIGESKDFIPKGATAALRQFRRNGSRLGDIPALIKGHYGELLSKFDPRKTSRSFTGASPLRKAEMSAEGLASANLAYRFAIAPMISDISKMLKFGEAVNRRIDWLNKLASGRDLRRKMVLDDSVTVVDEGKFTLSSFQSPFITAQCTVHHTVKVWGTIRYQASARSEFVKMGYVERRKLAQRLSSGLTSYGAALALWELTPWSWLTDWFANIGQTMAAGNNTLQLTSSHGCIMRYLRSERRYSSMTGPDWVTLSGMPREVFEAKTRKAASTVLPFAISIPQLNAGQLSILGSLAVLKSR